MSNLLQVIQSIAVNAVDATNPASLCFGTVTSADPLKIRLNESTLEVDSSVLILTEAVVERKLTIDKHTHDIGSTVAGHKHPFGNEPAGGSPQVAAPSGGGACTLGGDIQKSSDLEDSTKVVDQVLSVHWSEYGVDLTDKQVKADGDKVVITMTRALDVDDKVIMLRLMGGQKFLILSRVFEMEGDDED